MAFSEAEGIKAIIALHRDGRTLKSQKKELKKKWNEMSDVEKRSIENAYNLIFRNKEKKK